MNFSDLYKKISDIPIGDFPSSALSGLLHGYISVFSMVRVNPWLEEVYGSQWDIHERIREIAGELADLVNDPSISLEERVVHVADLLETYLMYSDMDFLDIALEAAYEIISPEGSDEIVLPCRTPEMCRLLCSCYYFTGEERCMKGIKEIVKVKREKYGEIKEMWKWWRMIEFYKSIMGSEDEYKENLDIMRKCILIGLNEQVNMNNIEEFILCFDVLATNEYSHLE